VRPRYFFETTIKRKGKKEIEVVSKNKERDTLSMSAKEEKDEPTWRCHHNPLVGALRIQEPVILGEPQIIS